MPKLVDHAEFTPKYYVWDGDKLGCTNDKTKSHCQDACHNKGKYCHMDPDKLGGGHISGRHISQENLRQHCAFKRNQGSKEAKLKWWKYVALVADNCLGKFDVDQYFTEECSKAMHERAQISFAEGRMVMESARPPEDGQDANFVHWCPEVFPRDIEISWDFTPLRLPGLAILFFAATGLSGDGEPISLFDPRLAPRAGRYEQYTSSDVSYLSLSYFRRRWEEEQRLHLVNLRAAPGFEMLAQGADPIPSEVGIGRTYAIRVRRKGPRVTMFIQDLPVLDWIAPEGRALPGAGHIGLRQMAPLKAGYANLRVVAI